MMVSQHAQHHDPGTDSHTVIVCIVIIHLQWQVTNILTSSDKPERIVYEIWPWIKIINIYCISIKGDLSTTSGEGHILYVCSY